MTTSGRVMMLIDGDNVSPDVIEQAMALVMADHGAIHVRRAYCTADAAVKQLALFKRHSIRPIVNLAAGKNSTDIAMAVDAMDLVLAERPSVVVIVSSDSDFAPLVIRLREKGCRVCGIGQAGKVGEETAAVYDAYSEVAHRRPRAAAKRTAAAPVAPSLPAPQPEAPVAAKRPARGTRGGRSRAATTPAIEVAPAPPPLPDEVQQVLDVLPELLDGGKVQLGIATERLRKHGLLARNAPSTRLFKKHPGLFVLSPERQPNHVQFDRAGPR